MSLIRYTPYSLAHLPQHVNRRFDQFDLDLFGRSEELGGGMFTPAVDVKEGADAYTVQMEVPGTKQENLNITLQENVLTIRGQKEQAEEHSAGQYRRVERSYGSFARSLSLPRNVDGNNVSANLHDGLLEIRLPKMEESKPRQISVGNTVQDGALGSRATEPAAMESGASEAASGAPGGGTKTRGKAPRNGSGGARKASA